jgi:hypothetical protein
MRIFTFAPDHTVRRLRWVMIGAMVFDLVLILLSQPGSYWRHPENADLGWHAFHFFLPLGWRNCILINLVYFSGAFLLASILPGRIALVGMFSLILGHYFGAAAALNPSINMAGAYLCGALLGLAVFPAHREMSSGDESDSSLIDDSMVKRLRWMMVGALLIDVMVTLWSQPDSYWHHPETVREGFPPSRFFMVQGLPVMLLYDLVCLAALFWLVSSLPRRAALVAAWTQMLCNYFGASTGLFNHWESPIGPIIYGVILSTIFVLLVFPQRERNRSLRIGGSLPKIKDSNPRDYYNPIS